MDYRTFRPFMVAVLAGLLFPWSRTQSQPSAYSQISDSVRAVMANRWDALVAQGMSPDSATLTVEREFRFRAEDAELRRYRDSVRLREAGFAAAEIRADLDSLRLSEIADETIGAARVDSPEESTAIKVGRWLWLVPLCVFVALILSVFRASRLKAWVGALHWGQLLILVPVLFLAGYLPMLVGLLLAEALPGIGEGQYWVLGFIPLGVIAALLVLWWWFGARGRKP